MSQQVSSVRSDSSIITKEFRGTEFKFYDTPGAKALVDEIFSDNYRVFESGISFIPGGVVLDVGACEGMFSIMIAKCFPFARVIALEPVPRTFFQMIRNIGLNGVTNIEAHNIGVGKEAGVETLCVSLDYSGGSSKVMTHDPSQTTMQSCSVVSMDGVFEMFKIDRVKLCKMDIEGMEYEVLYNTKMIPKMDFFTGEFHSNRKLDYDGRRIDALATWVGNQTQILYIEPCKMAE